MDWYRTESAERPLEVDKASSSVYNYVRKNIEEKQREYEGEIYIYYEYDEKKIPKEDWEAVMQVEANSQGIADLEDAICALTAE